MNLFQAADQPAATGDANALSSWLKHVNSPQDWQEDHTAH